jgi:drug/metabolite transporter (DMT)-like permease
MTHIGDMNGWHFAEMLRVFKAGVTSPQILAGIFFEAVFFACLMLLMARTDISFLWPMTALSFVFATFAAIWFLGESVSPVRWFGVAFIMLGAGLISYSEHAREKPPATAPVVSVERSVADHVAPAPDTVK